MQEPFWGSSRNLRPFFNLGFPAPRDFRRTFFSESLGSMPQGLAVAYDSYPTTKGIFHKHQVHREVSPVK